MSAADAAQTGNRDRGLAQSLLFLRKNPAYVSRERFLVGEG
jgi:hypothetical protein